MTTINLTDLQRLNIDVATLVFGIPVCDKPMAHEGDPCSLHGTDHIAPDDVPDYAAEDPDDPWYWDRMGDIVRAMTGKGYRCNLTIMPSGAYCYFTHPTLPGPAGLTAQTPPEAVARAAVAAMKAAKETQP